MRDAAQTVSWVIRPPPITPVQTPEVASVEVELVELLEVELLDDEEAGTAPATSNSRRAMVGRREASRGFPSPVRARAQAANEVKLLELLDDVPAGTPRPRMPALLTPQ